MKLERQIQELQAKHASEWYEILKAGRPEDLAAFDGWCRRSPLHIQEFLKISWTDWALDQLDTDRQIDVDALVRQVSSRVTPWALDDVREARAPAERYPAARPRRWAWGVAAGLAL